MNCPYLNAPIPYPAYMVRADLWVMDSLKRGTKIQFPLFKGARGIF
jgi:hypothetical protein